MQGMWGAYVPGANRYLDVGQSVLDWVKETGHFAGKSNDQEWLRHRLWPYARWDCVDQDAFACGTYNDLSKTFPLVRCADMHMRNTWRLLIRQARSSMCEYVGFVDETDYSPHCQYHVNGHAAFDGVESPPHCRLRPEYTFG